MMMKRKMCKLFFRSKRLWPKLLLLQKEKRFPNQHLHPKKLSFYPPFPNVSRQEPLNPIPRLVTKSGLSLLFATRRLLPHYHQTMTPLKILMSPPLCKHPYSAPKQHLPLSLIHLEKFKRLVQEKEPLTNAYRFPLAFIEGNPIFSSLSLKMS